VGARWLVIGGLAGAGTPLPLYAPRDAVEAVVGQLLGNPKNVARLLISLDLARAERKLREGAQVLRSVQGYPLDSEVASKLNDILMLDWPLGNAAASARLAIAGSVPDQLLEPVKAALKEFLSLLREASDPNVSFAGEYGTVALKFFGLVRRVEGWNAYENERRKIIDNWINLLLGYLEMAEAIYSVAETAAETASPSGKSESSEQRTPQGDFQAKLLWQRKFEDFPIWDVAISPDGRFLAVAGGSEYLIDKEGGFRLVRATDGALLKFLSLGEGNYASRVAFSPDGKLLAVEKGHHEVSLWRVDSGSLVRKKGSQKDLESFLGIGRSNVSPDGKFVAELQDVVIEDAPDCGGLVKVQQKMVVRWAKDGSVAWDFATGFECESPDAPPSPRSAAVFSPDGSLLAMAGRDGIIRIWSVKDRKLVGTLKMPAVYSLAFSKDGKLLAAGALTVPGEVRLWRVEQK
jgi:WD40 repeat protein